MAAKERIAAAKHDPSPSGSKPLKFLSVLRQENVMFDNKLQHDAQEMLRFVLSRLQSTAQSRISEREDTRTSLADPAGNSVGVSTEVKTHAHTPCDQLDSGNPAFISRKRLSLAKNVPPRKQQKIATKSSKKITDYFVRVQQNSPLATDSSAVTEAAEKSSCAASVAPSKQKDTQGAQELNFITRLFQGELVSQLHCYDCDTLTKRPELFFDVSVPVSSQCLPGFPEGGTPLKKTSSSSGGGGGLEGSSGGAFVGPFSLSWALSQFCYREKLCGDNKYKCENCNHLVEAEKTLLFSRLPWVMTVHLNRFTTHMSSYGIASGGSTISVTKISGNLAVPISLSLSAWCTQDCVNRSKMYHLFAVVFHTGGSCSAGHYTACIRGSMCERLDHFSTATRMRVPSEGSGAGCSNENNWFYFDDDYVEELSLEEVVEMLSPLTPSALTAYILFYTLENC